MIATFDGGFSPNRLPRKTSASIGIHVSGSFRSASGDQAGLPQLRRIAVAINREGKLFDRGLPTCAPRQIDPSSQAAARAACGAAIIGHGHVSVQARVPTQLPFDVRAKLVVFNGPWRGGSKLIYAEAYARDPPGAFLIVFRLQRRPGTLGTVLSTTLPIATRSWLYLTSFELNLRRRYFYDGRRRSLISAGCNAPPGFSTAIFPFARASYSFTNGRTLNLAQNGICTVADEQGSSR